MGGIPNTRRGYEAFSVVSAMQKAIRRSQVHEAIYWSTELAQSGHVTWCWNRLYEICTEDIGPADRHLPATIYALRQMHNRDERARNTATMYLTHAVILLATAPKSGIDSFAIMEHSSDRMPRLEVPDEAKDMHTHAGKRMGRGVAHFVEEGAKKIDPQNPTATIKKLEAEYMEAWR